MPTIRSQQFNDSFKGLTFFVEKKNIMKLKNIFLNDNGNNLNNLLLMSSKIDDTTIIAEKGLIVNKRNLFLINGQIISVKKNKIEIIKFEQLSINLNNLKPQLLKKPKVTRNFYF